MYNNIYECPTGPHSENFVSGASKVQDAGRRSEAIEKADGAVFRCMLSGSGADRWLLISASN